MKRALCLVLSLASLPVFVTTQAPAVSRPAPDALARSLQQRYQGITDFTADFTQTYRGGVLRTQTRETGTVSVKKPGRMRWLYAQPERKEFVSDGAKLYMYVPADKQVIVRDVAAADSSTGALFLAGRGDIARDFTATYADSAVAGAVALKLVPRRRQPDFEHLIVAVDPSTLQIRALTTRDLQGGDSTITFANLKENRGLADKDFAFRVPRGVNVITDSAAN